MNRPLQSLPRFASRRCLCAGLLGLTLVAVAAASPFSRPVPECADLFLHTDTCNTYLLRDGDAALLIDLGDGSVLDHLGELGVKRVEWVLFTHHHREQCQGAPRLAGAATRCAAPEAERALFERPTDFRKIKPSLGDPYTVHGASYVRPPIQPIPLARTFAGMDTFEWHGREFRCVATPGNSPGGMSYLLQVDGHWLAFSGDVMLDGARMHTWYDTEWDYGFAAGIHPLANSAGQLAGYRPRWLMPAHGPVVFEPAGQLAAYEAKLKELARLLVCGYDVTTFGGAAQDRVSTPTAVPNLWRVSPHLYKFRGPDFWPNFAMILADSGRALVVDCGLFDTAMLDRALQQARERLGLKAIDATIITHMHGDHFLEAPWLREKWGAAIWALDRMAPPCEQPERFDYAAQIPAYGKPFSSIRFDRLFKSGETFDWEGYRFTIDWMPGQTEFALCLHGVIDGQKVAFTGDNLFGDTADPAQNGHEALVARNSAILEEGYLYAAAYLKRLQPDLLIGGHSWVMPQPRQFIERYGAWAERMRRCFQGLSSESDYRYWFDPYWVRADPYRLRLKPGGEGEVRLLVRNFHAKPQRHRLVIQAPAGVEAAPGALTGEVAAASQTGFPVKVRAAANAQPGLRVVAVDVTLDDRRYGQRFDFLVEVTAP